MNNVYIGFYTNTGRYMGRKKRKNVLFLELRSWFLSGNYIKVKGVLYER